MEHKIRKILDTALDWVDDNKPRLTELVQYYAKVKTAVEIEEFKKTFSFPSHVYARSEEPELTELDKEQIDDIEKDLVDTADEEGFDLEDVDEEAEEEEEREEKSAEQLSLEDDYYWGRKVDPDNADQVQQVATCLRLLGQERTKSADLELVGRVRALDEKLLSPVALALQSVCPKKRAKKIIDKDVFIEAILVHTAATFAKGQSWAVGINKLCWPHKYWVTTTRIEEFVYRLSSERTYFNPHSFEQQLIRELKGESTSLGLRPFHWRNAVNRWISKEKEHLVPVIGPASRADGGYYCSPENHAVAKIELMDRRASFVPFSSLPEAVREEVIAVEDSQKIVREEDVYPPIARILVEAIDWTGKPSTKTVVVADCILDALVTKRITLNESPKRWAVKEKAYHFDRIYEIIEREIDE